MFYDNFGPLHESKFFWRYSFKQFFEIKDYVSFHTATTFSSDQKIYVLLKDYSGPWRDNGLYMKAIDNLMEKYQKQQQTDKYDVKIKRMGQKDSNTTIQDEQMLEAAEISVDSRTDSDIIAYAVRNLPSLTYFTSDFCSQSMLIKALKEVCGCNLLNTLTDITASFLCLANILGMKGEIISCPHKDIYFLETNTKSESTDLANMFASPAAGSNLTHIKCKPRAKLKQKYKPAQDFFAENKTSSLTANSNKEDNKCASSSNQPCVGEGGSNSSAGGSQSRRNSIDLYEEAATILGLTCSQTDDCKCIECQCHYFDFEEEVDFTPSTSFAATGYPSSDGGGGCEYFLDHNSSCAIQ